jgi:hypothetical protein
MAKTFDAKCWDLACHFLSDVPGATDDDRTQLARDLQQTAEDAILGIEEAARLSAKGAQPFRGYPPPHGPPIRGRV